MEKLLIVAHGAVDEVGKAREILAQTTVLSRQNLHS
jgi:hypothetical protein